MKQIIGSWQLWALLSATIAALTAIFAKIGIENVNSDFATFIRTIVIIAALAGFLFATEQWQPPGSISGRTYLFLTLWTGDRWLVGMLLSRFEDWKGRSSRPYRQTECRAGRHLRRYFPWREAHASKLDRRRAHRSWSHTRRLQVVT
jgi:hypothetical protein